jgi:hypothetical protein
MEEERDAISSKAWEGRLAAGWMTLGAGLEEVAGMVSMAEAAEVGGTDSTVVEEAVAQVVVEEEVEAQEEEEPATIQSRNIWEGMTHKVSRIYRVRCTQSFIMILGLLGNKWAFRLKEGLAGHVWTGTTF